MTEPSSRYQDRVRAFDPTGSMLAAGSDAWDCLGDQQEPMARAFWAAFTAALPPHSRTPVDEATIQGTVDYLAYRLRKTDGGKWIQAARVMVRRAYDCEGGMSALLQGQSASIQLAMRVFAKRTRGDHDSFARYAGVFQVLSGIEFSVYAEEAAQIGKETSAAARAEGAAAFGREVSRAIEATCARTERLRTQSVAAADLAREATARTSDVAIAAEQSAAAMNDAASTAAGLMQAITEARAQVELAADIARQAGNEAKEAVTVTDELSEHAEAIEAIMSLIKRVAGQTNLLALNATIEAARVGEVGRGFAVVANEVKMLASQTATAANEIAPKIAAIQEATARAVRANRNIRVIIDDVQASALDIRGAMERQAETVATITAAIDETAMAATGMSSTIAMIRTETAQVAHDIEEVQKSFTEVDEEVLSLRTSATVLAGRLID